MANQVTLTFAGDTAKLEDSFKKVGGAAKGAGDDVSHASEGFKKAGEAADEVDTKAMGFRDTMTGVQDTAKGTSLIMKGDLFNGFLTLGMGIGDLASGFYNLIIPALAKTKVATLAQAAASKIAAAGSKVWAAAQWVMNSALFASPITWIVAGIALLVVAIVLIARKTDWFSQAWRASWRWIQTAAQNAWDFIKKIPGWVAAAFAGVGRAISGPFKAAFNAIARAWNNTVGRLSWTVPGWVPVIGGNSISVPHLPTFHSGGIVPGVPGTPTVALLQAGERVGTGGGSGGDGGGWVAIHGDSVTDALIQAIAARVSSRSGRAAQLGIRTI